VILLVQFKNALQVRQTIGAQFKIIEKFVSLYTIIWLGTQELWPYKVSIIWFDVFVDGQKNLCNDFIIIVIIIILLLYYYYYIIIIILLLLYYYYIIVCNARTFFSNEVNLSSDSFCWFVKVLTRCSTYTLLTASVSASGCTRWRILHNLTLKSVAAQSIFMRKFLLAGAIPPQLSFFFFLDIFVCSVWHANDGEIHRLIYSVWWIVFICMLFWSIVIFFSIRFNWSLKVCMLFVACNLAKCLQRS